MPNPRLAPPSHRRILSPALILVFVASFGGLTGLFSLLSVVPLAAERIGSGGVGAGLTTGVLMFGTVVGELAMPRFVAAFGERALLCAGLALLGAPALVLPLASGLVSILVVSGVRGVGFGIVVVAGHAMVAALVPRERRGEGLGLYGLVVGVPSVIALPLGVWLAQRVGFDAVFVGSAVITLAALATGPALPKGTPKAEEPLGLGVGLRTPGLFLPSLVVLAISIASGAVVTFVPLAVTAGAGGVAALALFVQSVAATTGRWWAGRHGDRHGARRLVVPGVLATAVGIGTLTMLHNAAAILIGLAVFGAGMGVTQNATVSTMLDRVSTSGYGTVSALWNLAIDAGIGVGGIGFGLVAAQTGYPVSFGLTAGLLLLAVLPALGNRGIGSAARHDSTGDSAGAPTGD